MRDTRWRYIRYADGTEELYDHKNDPYEHKNLAEDPLFSQEKQRLSRAIPRVNAEDAPRAQPKRNRKKKKAE